MINGKQLAAVELLMSYPDSTVAEMLGVRLQTLLRWMQDPQFTEALRSREAEQGRALVRIARQAAVRAAAALCQVAGEQSKPDAKVLLELLKLSGAYEPEQVDPTQTLAEVIRLAEQAAQTNHEQQAN